MANRVEAGAAGEAPPLDLVFDDAAAEAPAEDRNAMAFEYVLVGSGPAGAVLADRLTEGQDISSAVDTAIHRLQCALPNR